MMTAGSAIIPPKIARGQTLGVIAPGGPIKIEKLRAGLAMFGDAFRLAIAPSLEAAREPNTPSYLSASDETRAAELNAMLANPDVRAILLARGGYGVMRILPLLDEDLVRADPKPIIGFSDATALLAWAHKAGVRGIHGPMGVQMGSLPASDTAQLIAMLTKTRAPGLRPWTLGASPLGASGTHRGPLLTGNLTMISVLVGTPWQLPLQDSIVLLEEVGEKPYELDRYLTQLILAGELQKPRAAIIGDLVRCADPNPPTGVPDPEDAALATVLERLHAAKIPTMFGAPIGHGARNEPVPFGGNAVVDYDRLTVEITDSAVA